MPKDNRSAMRKTIVARIATRDSSIPNPTVKQLSETRRLLEAVLTRHKGTPDAAVVEKLLAGLYGRRAR